MKIKILAAIVDTRQLTLYKEDGVTIVIKQGDPRLRDILDDVTPQIVVKGYAEIEIPAIDTGFQQFEKQSGVVRFFKVAREKLVKLFKEDEPVAEAAVGKVPELTSVTQTQAVIEEILANAQPVSAQAFDMQNIAQQGNIEDGGSTSNQCDEKKATHTVVAHVDGKLIPDMERIESHFSRASKLGSTKGVEAFLKRLAGVIDDRSHSVEDLLKFLERADLPIADDGSIIIYKVLDRKGDHYVDCHSKNVPQKVGSYVCMDIKLVDRNRNQECSNGLHVARRGYISGFHGNVCVVAKLAPEDVVTVPTYDANKMRVMGYHILHELPNDMFTTLRQNRPITNTDAGRILLGNLLAGNHIGRLEEVRITQEMGGGVVVTPLTAVVAATPKPKKAVQAEALANPEKEKEQAPIDPKDVVKKVAALSRAEQAQKLYRAYQKKPTPANEKKLLAFKKQVKLGWDKLGIPAGWNKK